MDEINLGEENIQLQGENILDDYQEENEEEQENEPQKKEKNVVIKLPEIKGPEFYDALRKINEYKRVFQKECEHIEINEKKMNLADLLSKIEECKECVANRKGNEIHKIAFKGILSASELYVAPALKLDLKGLTNTCMQDDDLIKTLDEISLLQDWSTKAIPPEQRLLLGIGQIAFRLNAHNKAKAKELEMPEKNENFDDL
jgi:hypothetical protein